MKVLMYGWEFPPLISGGLGVACYAIVKELANKQINIALVLPKAVENPTLDKQYVSIIGCNFLKDLDLAALKQLCRCFNLRESDLYLLHPYISCNSNPGQTTSNPSHLLKLLSTELSGRYGINLLSEVFRYALIAGAIADHISHDVIHCHDWLTILAGIEAKRRSHRPLIYHVHALECDRNGENVNQQIFNIEKYGLEQADRIIAVSQYTKDKIIQHYHISPEKITVVHNGMYPNPCCTSSKNNPQSKKLVLFVGRVTHQKGPHFFVEIAKKILSVRKDVQFVVAGDGNLLPEMIRHVAAARIGKHVHFTGFLDPDTVQKIYQLADVYVMPSISEPFGLTCLEALSNDVPVVISKQSGVAETLAHALKADFWDVHDMAAKILALLDHRALRKTILNNAKQELKQLTWSQAAQKIIDVYSQMTG